MAATTLNIDSRYVNFLRFRLALVALALLNPSKFYPVIKERWKNATIVYNESDSTSLAGFDVKFPSKMPNNYRLELGIVETTSDNGKHVFLYFSKDAITDSMKVNEFFAQKGISIYYRKEESDPQKGGGFEFRLKDYVRTLRKIRVEAYEVTINGHKALASNERDRLFHGYDIHDPSQVEFVTGKAHIIIQGYLPKEELIAIAQSIR